jgi:hypothetical protein
MPEPPFPPSQLSGSRTAFGPLGRHEPRGLVVLISALQLGLVLLVWVLAIVPAALLALGCSLVHGLRGGARAAPPSADR